MDNKELIAENFRKIAGSENVKINELMRNHTAFKLGGPADIFVTPDSPEKLQALLKTCKDERIPFFIMGNGSNLIVRDKGIRGVVIKLIDKMNKCSVKDDIIEAEAGVLLSKVANIALKNELAGLEFASGIPGTLGGAVTMNAGAYGGEMKDVILETEYIDRNGDKIILKLEQHEFGYRKSIIQQQGGIVLRSKLRLVKGNPTEIKAKMDDLNSRRKEKQPLEMPSAGSVFKRPEGFYVGKLVQEAGLKGYTIGGAQVSPKHCGFIVNLGNATSEDVIKLIEHIKTTIKLQFDVELSTEVKIVGEY